MPPRLLIAARASPLARAQAMIAAGALDPSCSLATGLLAITTAGDQRPASAPGALLPGKELFTREVDQAVLAGEADLAVHSLKDVPASLPDGLVVAAIFRRGDPRDALVGGARRLQDLMPGARVGGVSIRRRAQALSQRPDLCPVSVRGNVGTRIDKLDRGDAEALILSAAGLRRLGFGARIAGTLSPRSFLPAPGQGIIAALRRADAPAQLCASCVAAEHAPSRLAAEAERAFQARLHGSCRTPVAGWCRIVGRSARMDGEVLSPDGRVRWRRSLVREIDADQGMARALGMELADRLLADGAVVEP